MQLRAYIVGLVLSLSACAAIPAGPRQHPPEFDLPKVDGGRATMADFEGQVVLLDVWATWCKPCLDAFPEYAALVEKYGAQGFSVVAISVDEDPEDVRRFLEGKDFPFTILLDPEGAFADARGIRQMPTAFLLDRSGAVVRVYEGFVRDFGAEVEGPLRAALEGEGPTP